MNPYQPRYESSRALIIGINQYENVAPLSYAVHDAEGVAQVLTADLGFPAKHVTTLLDAAATKDN